MDIKKRKSFIHVEVKASHFNNARLILIDFDDATLAKIKSQPLKKQSTTKLKTYFF